MTSALIDNDLSLNPKLLWLIMLTALLTALIGFPLYKNNVERQTQKDARKTINKAARLQQEFFLTNGRYTDQVTELGLPQSGGPSMFMSTNWQYRIKIDVSYNNGEPYYLLTTVPYGAGADQRTIFTLDSNKKRTHQQVNQSIMDGW